MPDCMTLRKRLAAVGAALAMVALDRAPVSAQFASAIEGTITDTSGGVVPGATLTITNEETGVSQSGATSASGYYRFPALGGGLYTVRASLTGFKTVVQEHVRLQAAETKTINLALEVGTTEEQVTVRAAAPLIETAQGRVSGLIEESQVKQLPLVGRNFFNLVVLTPGVTGRATGGTQAYAQSNADLYNNEFGVNMNANGARAESNNFLIDSSTVSSSQRSGVVNINPNAESVQEVRVAVNNFTAEYGRNGSVLVNIITKSGTNDLHGSFGAYFTNDSLQAKNYFQNRTAGFRHPDFARKEFSWGLGGPILKDHTFFFTSGDVLRSDVAISRASNVITPEFTRFMEQNRPNNVSTYVLSNFPASFVPDRNFVTAGRALGSACSGSTVIASPVGPIPCNLPISGEGTWNETSPRDGLQWTARVDHNFNDGRDRLYGSFNRTTTDKVGFGEPSVYPAFTAPSPTNSMHVNTNYTKILSSSMVNEASFSWVRPWGELTNPHPEIPGIGITGIVRYQPDGFGPNEFVQNSFEWRDVVTWTRGSHSLKMGGAYTREHADNDSSRTYNRPQYQFNSVFDFAADQPFSQSNLAIDPETGGGVDRLTRFHRTQSVSAFVQEDWKVKRNLTVNLGLRYEGFLNIYDASGDMANIVFTTDSGDLRTDLASARVVERHYYLEGGLWSGGMHTLAPRVSFAWDPTGDALMSIRGGFGRSYERMSNQIWDSEHLNLPGFATTQATINDPVKPVFGLGRNTTMPYDFPRPVGLTGGLNRQGGLINGRALVHVTDPNIDTMYLDNWFFGVQRAFGRIAVEADYIGSRGDDGYRKYNINRFNGDLFDGRFDGVIPGFSAVNYTQSTDESKYHGATFGMRMNTADLQFGAAYTVGKATDFSSSFSATAAPDAYGPPDREEGPADFDVRQKFAMSASWKLPGPSEGALQAILGGWQVAGVLVAQSGTPFTVFCGNRAFSAIRDGAGNIIGNSGCDYNADGTNNDRPNVPAFGDSKSGLSNDDFLDGIFVAADFPTPAPGQQGNLGRNTFRGPRYFNVDLVFSKSVRVPWMLGSGGDLQFRLESFNLFNTTDLFNPDADMTSGTFGRPTQALPGRIIQFATRFAF
jgi:hypothetical protein